MRSCCLFVKCMHLVKGLESTREGRAAEILRSPLLLFSRELFFQAGSKFRCSLKD